VDAEISEIFFFLLSNFRAVNDGVYIIFNDDEIFMEKGGGVELIIPTCGKKAE
jgi:hypothetical protein